MQCCALHWNKNGNKEPQCQYCEICKEPIRPENFNDECEKYDKMSEVFSKKD